MEPKRLERSLRATFIGMAVTAVLAAAKFAAGILGHSHALIADGVESTADLFSSVIVTRGLIVAAQPADREHPYGHGKAEPLAAAAVSIVLFLAALGIMIRSAQGLFEQREAPHVFSLYVLIGVVVLKELLFRFVSREAGSLDSIALSADAWHHRSDAITSLAAAIGIALAVFGGPRFACADDGAALLAGVIIAWNGRSLLRPALDELMDAAPGSDVVADIRKAAGAVAGVNAVEKCIVRKTGFQYLVDMHVEVDPLMTVQRAHEIAHHVKDAVRQAVPAVSDVLVHVEPSH